MKRFILCASPCPPFSNNQTLDVLTFMYTTFSTTFPWLHTSDKIIPHMYMSFLSIIAKRNFID